MQLSNSPSSTAWIGALIGLFLGVVAGAVLTGLGTPVEGAEGVVQLPVLATIGVMAIGGAILGGLTATVTQAIGVPVAVPEGSGEEIETVRQRLGFAFGIPLTALLLLLILVLPFAWALIQSHHLSGGSAALIGILVASGILGFASLAGTKPNIKLSFGEVMVAVIGIGTIVVFILAVMFARSPDEESEEPAAGARGSDHTRHRLRKTPSGPSGHLPQRRFAPGGGNQLRPAALARSDALMAAERSPWARAVRILRATSRATWI